MYSPLGGEREKASSDDDAKEPFRAASSYYFRQKLESESRYFSSSLSLSRENKSARALKRERKRASELIFTQTALLDIKGGGVLVFRRLLVHLCSSFERARKRSLLLRVGCIEESIQVLSALVPHHETTLAYSYSPTYTNETRNSKQSQRSAR